jgi:hypothetical protein
MILGSMPYVVATVRGEVEGGQTYLLSRIGEYTRAPQVGPLIVFILGLLLAWKFGEPLLARQEHKIRLMILILLLLAGLAGLNVQILSGYDAAHAKHFWNRLIQPVGFFLAGCGLFHMVERHKLRRLDHVAAGVLVIVLLNAGARQLYAGSQIAEQQEAAGPEVELLTWIGSHVPGESVIGTVDFQLGLLIPVMGPNFSYVPTEKRTLTPTDEILNRCHELALLLAASPDDFYRQDLVCGGTPRSFFEEQSLYSQTRGHRNGRPAYKLDYVVDRSGRPVPPLIAASFPQSAILHVNQEYQLIQLGERR